MSTGKNRSKESRLHIRNKNRTRYDFEALVASIPALRNHIILNKYRLQSIDFSNPQSVKLLNTALLHHYYGIESWTFPDENLCPPIPGRADYIHHLADILGDSNMGEVPTGGKINCLDVGVGASCIYPIIGFTEYGWRFIGSDTDTKSIASATNIVNSNPSLKGHIHIRRQKQAFNIFHGIIQKEEKFDVTMCNPPFHASMEDAQRGTRRKIKGLGGTHAEEVQRNFSGVHNELVYPSGEFGFIQRMTQESKQYSNSCLWFSTLVSKQSNLNRIEKLLDKVQAKQTRRIPMGTGNKSSRIVAWTFLSDEQQSRWREERW